MCKKQRLWQEVQTLPISCCTAQLCAGIPSGQNSSTAVRREEAAVQPYLLELLGRQLPRRPVVPGVVAQLVPLLCQLPQLQPALFAAAEAADHEPGRSRAVLTQ